MRAVNIWLREYPEQDINELPAAGKLT